MTRPLATLALLAATYVAYVAIAAHVTYHVGKTIKAPKTAKQHREDLKFARWVGLLWPLIPIVWTWHRFIYYVTWPVRKAARKAIPKCPGS